MAKILIDKDLMVIIAFNLSFALIFSMFIIVADKNKPYFMHAAILFAFHFIFLSRFTIMEELWFRKMMHEFMEGS